MQIYDGPRSRSLPRLYEALTVGTDDDRMKGALWTLNTAAFGKLIFNFINAVRRLN